jgi:hypothetical protein
MNSLYQPKFVIDLLQQRAKVSPAPKTTYNLPFKLECRFAYGRRLPTPFTPTTLSRMAFLSFELQILSFS